MKNTRELLELRQLSSQAAALGRDLFLSHYNDRNAFHLKKERDPVSVVDVEIEQSIRTFLGNHCPEVPVIGEELGAPGAHDSPVYWVVDPIDGTVNYLSKIPLCGISIALVENGIPVLGCIDFPVLGQLYTGGQGVRSELNGEVITPTCASLEFSQCIVALGDYSTGNGSRQKNERKIRLHQQLADQVYRVRMVGSAALDLCWTASGQFGASITLSNNAWDMAAGVAISRGCGVTVCDIDGTDYTTSSRCVIASRQADIAEKLCKMVSPILR
jgi:myo-inositol-1(or 4)-monophosphatase